MFHKGEYLIYGIHGVCLVSEVREEKFGGKREKYYVLCPMELPDARYYVPVGSEAVSKLRSLATRETIQHALDDMKTGGDPWIADENQRKQRYRELIADTDPRTLLSMVHSIRRYQQQGGKLHMCDENFQKDAERLLSNELSIVLGIQPAAVGDYIRAYIA